MRTIFETKQGDTNCVYTLVDLESLVAKIKAEVPAEKLSSVEVVLDCEEETFDLICNLLLLLNIKPHLLNLWF
jgi:hypothetical protein